MNNSFCYIHIPFCTSKCKYCRFASFGTLDSLKINLYVSKLINEIKKSKIQGELSGKEKIECPGVDLKDLRSIYFGGGTPSVLSEKQLLKIIETLNEKYTFSQNIEINIEATPNTINIKNLEGWKKIGINRISCGLQTLNNDSLIEIGRGNKGDIIKALDSIKQYLSKNNWKLNMSIDFIIGLPFVKKGEIKQDINYILNNYNFIKHISVYMLEEYYYVPEYIDSKFENITYPNNWKTIGIKEEDYLEEYIEINNLLKKKGFNRYEISSFAKKGYECKHNKAYWNHSEVLAFGLGSYGYIDNKRYSNSEDFLDYYNGKNIITEKLNDNDIFVEKVMFGLRTGGLTGDIYKKLDKNKINYFLKNNYLQKKSDKIIISNKGVLVLDYILKEIL